MQLLVIQPLVKSITGAFSGSGTGGLLGGLFGRLFGGKRASGGPVSANKPYMVGERGPEMVVPHTAGRVVPNHMLNGGQRQAVIVNQTLNLSPGLQGTVQAEIVRFLPQIKQVSEQSVSEALQRGGNLTRQVRRT